MMAVAIQQLPRTLDAARRLSSRALRTLSHQAQRLGPLGIVGVALLAFSLVFFLSANSPLHRELDRMRSELAQAKVDALAGRRPGAAKAPGVGVIDFVGTLPPRSELPSITRHIVDEASGAGLELERGTYSSTVTTSGRIVRARLNFPVTGSYPEIRDFVGKTLATIPSAAVDSLRLERKTVGTAEVDAEVSFAVFLRNDP